MIIMEAFKDMVNSSHSYFITTRRRMNVNDLIVKLHDKQQEVDFIRKNNAYFIYKPEYSTRGVELTKINDSYVIKMNFLANAYDYNLCNYIAHIICKKFDGILIDEEGNRRRIGKLFNEQKMNAFIYYETDTLFDMLEKEEEIEIQGIIRPFTIGKRTRDRVMAHKNEKYKYEKALKLAELILDCQYPSSLFIPFCDMLESIVNNEKINFAQVLSNKQNMVIEKVRKYFISEIYGNLSIELTMDHIISILPGDWILLDDCTILAKKLTDDNWAKFVTEAKIKGKIIE